MKRLLPCLLVAACGGGAPPEDVALIVENVRGYTMTGDGLSRFSMLVVDGGRVVAVGEAALAGRYRATEVIDGAGRTLLPGLIDAHAHPAALGLLRRQLDLSDAGSRSEALAAARTYAAANPGPGWLLGGRWNHERWEDDRLPTAAELDAAVADRPAWLERVDGHAGWANTRALEAAGITADTPDPPGGRILRDAAGEPTGVLIDAAMALVEAGIPAPSPAEIERALRLALTEAAALGLTNVHDMGVDAPTLAAYRRLAESDALPIRVYVLLAGADEMLDAVPVPFELGRLKVGGVKLYADGALGSRGAALLAPYSDEPGNGGLLFADADELADAVARAHRQGFQAAIHAIGDRANRVALDAFADAGKRESPIPPDRIEHAQVIALEDIPRFAELGIVASVQPTHATSDKNMAEDRIGAERMRGAYAWQRLLEAGASLAAGSDFPVEPPNPFYGLHAAVTRRDRDGEPPGGWYSEQALTREEALAAFTLGAARAAGQDGEIGSLEPGKRADFVLIDRDYFEVPAEDIWRIRVLGTWIDGAQQTGSR